MKSAIFKAITAVLAMVGFIGSIIIGVTVPTVSYNAITEEYTNSFNVGLMFSCLVGTIILCLIFGGITCILAYLEELGAGKTTNKEAIVPLEIEQNSEPIEKDDWICPKCGRINKKYVGSCGCGTNKPNK